MTTTGLAVTPGHVVVVGGGAMGSATAWWLARTGHRVTLVERFAPGHRRGSSHGGSRIFRLGYRLPGYVHLAAHALRLWRLLERESGMSLLATTGGVDHGPAEVITDIAVSLRAAGLPYEQLSPGAAAERWPGMRFDQTVLTHPDAGRLDADLVLRALHQEAARHGASIMVDTEVTAILRTPSGTVVLAGTEPIHANVVVLAVGAWLPSTLHDLDRPITGIPPLRVAQEQPAYFTARTTDATAWPSFVHRSAAGASHRAGYGHYGLFTPRLGVKVGAHGAGLPTQPDDRPPVSADRTARLCRYVERWLPGLEPVAVTVDSCLTTSTPDDDFLLRRTGSIVICAPCSGHGFKFTPAIGKITAELATTPHDTTFDVTSLARTWEPAGASGAERGDRP